MALGFTVPREPERRPGPGASVEPPHRVLLLVGEPGEADALAEGLASYFSFDVLPVSTPNGARMALVARSYDVVVLEGRFGLRWLEGLEPRPRVVVLGVPRRGTVPDAAVVVEAWPGPVSRLAEAIRTVISS